MICVACQHSSLEGSLTFCVCSLIVRAKVAACLSNLFVATLFSFPGLNIDSFSCQIVSS